MKIKSPIQSSDRHGSVIFPISFRHFPYPYGSGRKCRSCSDYRYIEGTSPWMDKGRIMQELLSRAKQGENHEMMVLSERHGGRTGFLTRTLLPEPRSNYRPGLVFLLSSRTCSGIQLLPFSSKQWIPAIKRAGKTICKDDR